MVGLGIPPPRYHVWVVPVPRACHWLQDVLVVHEPVQDGEHAPPGVLDVVVVAPEVAGVRQQTVVHLDGGGQSPALESRPAAQRPTGLGRPSRGQRVGTGKEKL